MRLLLSPMVISMTDKKHLSSASQEKLSSYSSSASKNATSSSNTSAKNNLKRTISTASPQGAEDEDKRPQPKRRKSTGAEVPHGSGSSSRKVAAPRPMPLSERQQLALLMQMTAAESQQSDSDRIPALPSSAHKRSTAKVEKRNERGETALHIASKRGDIAEVKKLINAGANVNVTDYAGWTALHEACNRGHQTIARLLLKAGANVNVQGMDNDTPLHDAATSGHCKLVQLLLRHGANPSQCNKQGKSPLDLASSAEVLRLLRSELITSASSCSSESLLEPRSPTSPESAGDDDRRLASPAKGIMPVTPAKIESRTPSSGGVPQLSPQSMWTPSSNLKVDDGVPPSQPTQLSPRLSVDSSSSQHYQSHGHGDQSSPRLTLKICRKESTSSESNVTAKQNSYSVTLASSKDKERLDSGLSPVGSSSSDDSGDAVKFKSSNSSISFVGSKSQQQQQHREDVTLDSTEANALSSADKMLNSPRLPQSSSGSKGASITKGTSGKSASTRDSGRTESDLAARPAFSSLSSSLSSMPVIGGSSSTSVISSVRSSESVSRTLAATQYTYGASSLSRSHHAPAVSTPSWLNGSSGSNSSSGSSGSGTKARVPLTSGTSQSISSSSLSATANHSARSSLQGHVNTKNKDVPAVGTSSLHSMQRAEKSPYSVGGMTTHAKPPQQPPATGASITFRNGSAPIPAYPPHHTSTTSASFQNKVTNGRSNTTSQHSSTPVTHTPKQQSPLLASFEDISDSEDDQQQSVGKNSKSVSKPLSFAMSSGPASSISTPPSSNIVRHTTIPSSSTYGSNNSSLSRASLPSSAASQNSAAMFSGSTNGLKPLPDMNASKAGLNGVRMSSSVDSHKASLAWSTISSDKPMYQRSGNWTSTNGGHGSRGVPSDGKSSAVVPSLPSSANSSMMKLAGMSQDLPRASIPTLPGNSGQVTSVIVGNSSSREKAVNKPTTPLSALDNRSSLTSMPTLPYSSQKVPSGINPSSITATSSVALPKTNGGPPALYVGREVDKTMLSVNANSKHAEINSSNKIRLNRGVPESTGTQASLLQSQLTEDVAAKRRKFESTSEMKPQVLNAKADIQQQEASVRSSMPPLQALSNGPTSAGSQQTSLPSKAVAKVEFPSVTVDTPTSKTLVDVSKQLIVAQVGQGTSPTTFDSKDKDSVVRDRVTTLAASISPAAASLPAIQEKVDGRLPCTNSPSESSLQSLGKVSTTATIASSPEDASFHLKIGPAKSQDPGSTSPVDKIAVSIPHKATAGEKTATTDFSPSSLAMKDTKEKATEEASKTFLPSPTADEDTARDVKKEVSGEVTKETGSKHEDDNEEQESSRPATPKVPPIRIILSGTHNADKESKDVPGKHALPYVVNTMDRASLPGSASPTGKVLPPGESDEQLGDEKSRTRGEGDKMADFEDEVAIGKEAVGERRVTRSALRAQREKKQLGGKTGSTDIKTGEEQSSEKDAATVNEVSEELPVHPRKRKLTRARINNEPAELVVPIELPVDPHNLYIIDKQDNPYRSVRDLKKKMMQRHSQLLETPVSLKAPDDFKSYLLSSRNYLLSGKSVPLMPRSTPSTPPTVPLSLQTLYSKQEYQRQQLERQHVVEKEKVVLAMEMQLLREHARGYVETSAGGLRSLSFCSLMRDQGNLCSNGRLVEEARASTRSHSSSRDLLRWKKEVLDKFEKIKADVCGRQRFEAEALQASQRLEWEWMLVQNHLCDSRTVPQVDALCVPMASVDDEFIVNRQVSRRTV